MPNWNYCVVARFDDATDKKLTDLKAAFLAEGYGGVATNWPPHITLCTYETVDREALIDWTHDYAQTLSSFDVALGSCGILPPGGDKTETAVLYAAPCSSQRLIDFYFGYHTKLNEYYGDSGWFYSAAFGHPAIHATIGIVEVKRLQRALELVFAGGIFGKSQIEALEVYKYPMELVARYELKRNGEIPHQLQVTLRQERESDYDDVYKLITAAFGNKIEGDYGTTADYMNAVRNKSTFIPKLSLVAENDRGEIVGQITLYETNITTASGSITELVLSPISVSPELFGRGIARQMVETALSKAKDMGYRAVFLCGKPDLYHRLGFSATYHYGIHHVRDPQAEWSMVHELYENALSGINGKINTD